MRRSRTATALFSALAVHCALASTSPLSSSLHLYAYATSGIDNLASCPILASNSGTGSASQPATLNSLNATASAASSVTGTATITQAGAPTQVPTTAFANMMENWCEPSVEVRDFSFA